MTLSGKAIIGLFSTLICSFSLSAKAIEPQIDTNRAYSQPLYLAQSTFVSFPSAGIQLRQPDGFTPATRFDGFMQESSQASIMVLQLPGPYSEISEGLNRQTLKSRGIQLKSKESVQVDGGAPASLLNVTQEAFRREFSKWILVTGNESNTTFITATFPSTEKENLSEDLKSVLLDLKIDQQTTPISIGYSFAESKQLKLSKTIGKNLLYTEDGTIPVKSAADPFFIAGPAISTLVIEDQKAFAQQRLLASEEITVEKILSNEPVTIAELSGYEILAEAIDPRTETPLTIYQTILFTDDSYFLTRGSIGRKKSKKFIPEFQRLTRSLKFDEETGSEKVEQ